MPQEPLELILTRQWASYLAMPVWVMDSDENLVYCNEMAEALLSLNLDAAGPMPLAQLAQNFQITSLDGVPLEPRAIPIGIALRKRKAAHQALRWCTLDGIWRQGEVTAFPLEGAGGRFLGAVAIFWEIHEE
jgi:PAS domain-containing protein